MNEVTILELIALLRKPGKASICMAGTETLITIDKSDMIAMLKYQVLENNLAEKPYMVNSSEGMLHIEAIY